MGRRISSLDSSAVGIEREIGSEYDNIKAVADNLPGILGSGGVSLPPGGSAGQILSKVDSTDGNAGWADPPAGGGGGGSGGHTQGPIAARLAHWAQPGATPPTTFQLPAVAWLEVNTSYLPGDVIVVLNHDGDNLYVSIAIVMEAFTTTADAYSLNSIKLADQGKLWVQDFSSALGYLSSGTLDRTTRVTAADLSIHGNIIVCKSVTFNNVNVSMDSSGVVVTAGTPVPIGRRHTCCLPIWLQNDLALNYDGFFSHDDDTYPYYVVNAVRSDRIYEVSTKSSQGWGGYGLCLALPSHPSTSTEGASSQLLVTNGAVVPFDSMVQFCATTPVDGSTIYQTATDGFNDTGSTLWFDTVPTDVNTIAIGTYNTANGGTLTVGIS